MASKLVHKLFLALIIFGCVFFICWFGFVFLRQGSLYIVLVVLQHYIHQAGLELRDLPAYQVQGRKMSAHLDLL